MFNGVLGPNIQNTRKKADFMTVKWGDGVRLSYEDGRELRVH